MLFLESPSQDPYFNLALEEALLTSADRDQQYLMLWQNRNSIIVGKFQNTAEEINQPYVDAHGITVARRLSGGGAVYHDLGNLNYSIVVDQEDLPDFNFQFFTQPVLRALETFGVHAEFNGRNDVLIGGRKFSGCSQFASRGRLLHHGCIMLDSNLNVLAEALRVRDAKFTSKSVSSVPSRVTTINANAPSPISMADFKSALTGAIFSGQPAREYAPSGETLRAAETLRREKYSTWDWNYGYCGDYETRREKKFPSGLVTVRMNVRQARIQAIRFSGDFFGNGDIRQLEEALVGLPLNAALTERLEAFRSADYINGVTAAELCGLLL